MDDFSDQLKSLIAKIHPGTQSHHEKLNALEHTMRVEYDGLYRHIEHVKSLASSLQDEAIERLRETAMAMGYVPAAPPPIQQMQPPEHDMPRVARQTPAERTVSAIYGMTG